MCYGLQIALVEHAMLPVLRNHRQVLQAQLSALIYETAEVSLGTYLVGAHALRLLPYRLALCECALAEHPAQHDAHVVGVVNNWEDACCLQVVATFYCVEVNAALCCPFGERATEVFYVRQITAELVVETVRAHSPTVCAYGHDVDTLTLAERQRPVVLGHTCHNVVLRQRPVLAYVCVLHPFVAVLLCPLRLQFGVLHEDRRMWLAVVVHNLALVVHNVLYGEHRREQLVRCAEMVELATWQRQYHGLQCVYRLVLHARLVAESAAELAVHVVVHHLDRGYVRSVGRTLHEHFHGAVGENPYTDVGEVEVVGEQCGECLHRRLLKHTLQLGWLFARTDEHAVVLRYLRAEPQTVAYDVRILGYRLQRFGGAYVHVAAHYHRVQTAWGDVHDALVERHLQRQQVLVQTLSAFPAEHWQRCKYLARWSVRRQSATLSAGVQE